jgi:adenylate kinase family enzyme
MHNIKKIMIFGRAGSGKSTFALQLHKALNIPLYNLDKYFFTANWVERDYPEFLNIQQQMVDSDAWIIDGNCIKSLEMRYSKADIVLYFIYPKTICYFRVFKRLFYKNKEIDDRALNCPETIGLNLIKYIWGFENRVNDQINDLKEKYPNVKFFKIKNTCELNNIKNKLF